MLIYYGLIESCEQDSLKDVLFVVVFVCEGV